MDRLARSLTDLLHLVKTLNERNIVVEFAKQELKFKGD